jgi:predicted phosphodiesterase
VREGLAQWEILGDAKIGGVATGLEIGYYHATKDHLVRLLLITDTHGKLALINELAGRVKADAVVHAGDFGFYDDRSPELLSDRELRLHVAHSDLPQIEKARIPAHSRNDLTEAVKRHRLLGEFQSFLDGVESFHVPVYAVWGNHEDRNLVERLFRGDVKVDKLHILHHRQVYRVGAVSVYGLGGNLLPGSKMMQQPIAGSGGKIWSTLSQYSDLVETVDKDTERIGPRLFVSHVSPGKEPFVELIGVRTRADFTISGHMGAPTCMVWSPFTVSSVAGAKRRLWDGLGAVRKMCVEAAKSDAQWVDRISALIAKIPGDTFGEGAKTPYWYKGMTHVNLPDAHVGHAVLDVDETGSGLQTFIR